MSDASALGMAILQAVGDRELTEAQKARDVVRRNKAYSLVVRAYDEVRDGLAFLRRVEGDADRIAPSVLAFRGTSPKKKGEPVPPGASMLQGGVNASFGVLGPKTTSMIVPDDDN